MKFFVWSIILIVTAAIVAGFFIVGSPATERLRQLDAQRLTALQMLQSEIVYYWQHKSKLPAKLSDLTDPIRGFQVPVDPKTGLGYGYSPTGTASFSLCANFDLPSQQSDVTLRGLPVAPEPYGGIGQSWQHGTGYACFDRTIDKDFYKPIPPLKKA